MGWNTQDVARAGQFVMGEVVSGINLNFIFGVTENDILSAVRAVAVGWEPVSVQWQPGVVITLGESLRIFGRATADTPSAAIANQMASGVNSFWAIAGASVSVSVSDNLTMPSTPAETFSTVIQWTAAAVIVAGVAWIVYQIRKVTR